MSDDTDITPSTDVAAGNGAQAGVPLTQFDDPHLQPYAKNPRRAEMLIGVLLLLGLAGFCAYGGLYWVGGQTQWEAVFGGIGFLALGFGLSAWGKYLLPQGPFVEERHNLHSTDEEIDAMAAAIEDRGKMVFRRRGFLGTILGAGAGVMGVVLTFPLLRSLGPQPKTSLETTNWRKGSFLVDLDGKQIHQTDLEVGGSLTVFPQGFAGSSVDQTMLIRADDKNIVTMPGRETWGPKGYLAYSKLCTHAGCPVGLYEQALQNLLCPCHQSLFKVLEGAKPVFGPAPRPLPQLPLRIDSSGFLVAQAGYDQPVGPGFWERS
jgi:ubiquinol-cytochrome c reductase iron-sulfur subunit